MHEDNKPILFNATIFKSTISSQTSLYYSDIGTEDLLSGDSMIKDYGIKSLLTVPLIAKGSPIGSLNLGSLKPNRFTKEDIVLAEGYALHMAIAIDNSKLYTELQNLFVNTIMSFSSAIDAKSSWTQNHSSQVANYAIAIARRFGLDESSIEDLRIAVLLHDIGKIGIPDLILDKTSWLSKEEREEMQKHPLYGVAILQPIQEMKRIIPIVRHHHEHWDGTGYPDGLSGNMIPLGARILSVADAFESMITDRPYRKRLTLEETKIELLRSSGAQFDAQVVAAFLSLLEEKSIPF
jgi:putative nucleotidyltransferase with HDIG domain